MASAWLIRRFIDPHATFAFVDAAVPSEVAFDISAERCGHRDQLCTFEVLCCEFGISENPAVTKIAHIVHDLDLKDDAYGESETAFVGQIVAGLQAAHVDDGALLEQGIAMFEALIRLFDASIRSQELRTAPGNLDPVP